MTAPCSMSDPAAVWTRVEDECRARVAAAREVLGANKASLFDALAGAGITSVEVIFDGAGDSGQIESITAQAGSAPTDLPASVVVIAVPRWDGSGIDHLTLPLSEAIEKLAYEFLEDTHGGWEINEGAYGEFRFDVRERSIQLDFNQRIEASDYHGHSW